MISDNFDFNKEKYYFCEECGYRWVDYAKDDNYDDDGNVLMDSSVEMEEEIYCPQCGSKIT